MKKNNIIFHLATVILCGIALTACRQESDFMEGEGNTVLSLAPTVTEMGNSETVTRAATNNFFKEGDKISVEIKTNRANAASTTSTYTLGNNGIFTGDFRFNLDNTYITELIAKWPEEKVREEGIVLDQRKWEDYLKADRLIANSENVNIMPTAEPVPLIFEHEQSRFSFRMAGQNANGLNILSIVLELQYDSDNNPTTKESHAFWAYCDTTETASLILKPDVEIKGSSNDGDYTVVDGRYMIGMAEVGNETTQYTGGIWLDGKIAVTLKPNTDYLVTLTPEGYNLAATIEIHGFGQDEGYIGVPTKPENN